MGDLGKTENSFSDSSPTYFFNPFLLFQMKKESSFSTLSGITSAVAWAHMKLGLYSPTESALTKQLFRAGQGILGCETAKGKHPLTVEHLKSLEDKFAYASLDQLQIVTLATLLGLLVS